MKDNIIDEFLDSGAIFTLPNKQIAVGIGEQIWQKERNRDFSFYFPDFFLENDKPWLSLDTIKIYETDEFTASLHKPTGGQDFSWVAPKKVNFTDEINNLQQIFSIKLLKKAVPYVFEKSFTKFSKESLNKSLFIAMEYAKKYSLNIYGFWNRDMGFLGATPELLFNLQGRILKTIALAGTFNNSKKLPECEKLINEHSLVIKGICENICGFGEMKIGRPFALPLPGFSHIAQSIEVDLQKEATFEGAVKALHPTPALGTYPKKEGKKWLREQQEKYPRYRYGAPVGYVDGRRDFSACFVAIRNIQWFNESILLGAGCGVTAGSRIDDEWKEIHLKIRAIKGVLGLC